MRFVRILHPGSVYSDTEHGGQIGRALASRVRDRASQTNELKISTCRFLARRSALLG